jgi:energy-coupling factor transporter ATP-binding protein EcfA2
MRITFEGKHKSLNSFESEDLTDFVVITGKNGSGKTQLIEILKAKAENTSNDYKVYIEPELKKIQFEGIDNNSLSAHNNESWRGTVNSFINQYRQIDTQALYIAGLLISGNKSVEDLQNEEVYREIENQLGENLEKIILDILTKNGRHYPTHRQINHEHLVSNFINGSGLNNKRPLLVAEFVSNYRKKPFHLLEDKDFFLTPIPEKLTNDPRLFNAQIDTIFYHYAKRRDQNRRLYFEKREDNAANDSIPDQEFVSNYPPPWETINQILEVHNLDFRFDGVDRQEFTSDAPISFPLIKTSTNSRVEIQNLSSGEKIIIGLIIRLFTSSYYNDNLDFPELIVLDEPDAHLHPEMSKLLIDVLEGTFVKKIGIKVIMTTHSPSTVALCPENSLYQLQNTPVTSLTRINKEEALKLLTGFIPTLTIDYKNHKQVYVESPTDLLYYQTIFDTLQPNKKYPFRLYFISYSYGKGNCSEVERLVNDLRKANNRTSFGVIDWDLKNKPSAFIKVHGYQKRYSIERFLFDPIYLAVLLMNRDGAHNIHAELELPKSFPEYSLGEQNEDFLQKVADKILAKVSEANRIPKAQLEQKREVNYYNGKVINLPVWFLDFVGHDFEEKITRAFPALQGGKFSSTGALQKELTKIVAKCYPFIPSDSVEVIEEIIFHK